MAISKQQTQKKNGNSIMCFVGFFFMVVRWLWKRVNQTHCMFILDVESVTNKINSMRVI